MQYRKDKRSNIEISALGFGCMRLPGKKESEQLICKAVEAGINYFDTAYAYAGNEELLGTILAENNLRNRVFIATKLPHKKATDLATTEKLFQTSLTRLKTDYVDYFLIHNVTSLAQWQRLVDFGMEEWVAQKKQSGALVRIGFSFHGALPEFKKLLDAYDWDFCQIQYNYVNEFYQAGREGLELAASKGLPVIIMEPLLGGKLATGLPKKSVTCLQEANPNYSCAAWGLRWLWNQEAVTCVLSGMNSMQQLEDNIAIASGAIPGCMTQDEQEALDRAKAAFMESYKIPCTGCNYCMPCPKGINIPAAFAAYNESYALKWYDGFFNHILSVGFGEEEPKFVARCTSCGACSKKCPQHIDVPNELIRVRKRFEPAVVRALVPKVSKFF